MTTLPFAHRRCAGVLAILTILAFLSLPTAPVLADGSAPGWTYEAVAFSVSVAGTLPPRALAVDAAGRTHVVYGWNRLYHAWLTSAGWQLEVIDVPSSPSVTGFGGAELAFDAAGRPHVAYATLEGGTPSQPTGQLRYAVREPAGWTTQAVYTGTIASLQVSLALDAAGMAHIGFYDVAAAALRYVGQTSHGWQLATVDAAAAPQSSLAIGPNGQPSMAYVNATTHQLLWAVRNAGGDWAHEPVAGTSAQPTVSLVVDALGAPHISYASTGTDLVYAVRTGPGNWNLQLIPAWGHEVTSLVLDAAGHPHIFDGRTYITQAGSAWVTTSPPGVAPTGGSLALDPSGDPHVAYSEPNDRALWYALPAVSGWAVQLLDQDKGVWLSSDRGLQVGADGQPQLVYSAKRTWASFPDTHYAGHTDDGWRRAFWITSGEPSLGIDPSGKPYVAGHDCHQYYFVRHWNGSAWDQLPPVPGLPRSMSYSCAGSSLAVAADGTVYLSYKYWDTSATPSIYGNLAILGGTAWATQTVSAGTSGGLLALDPAGRPHLVYPGRYYYRWTGAAWVQEADWSFRPSPTLAWSFALDAAGVPHISFYDTADNSLHYLTRTNGAWSEKPVTSFLAPQGTASSIAVDARGAPHIAYYNSETSSIEYARKAFGTWTIVAVAHSPVENPAVSLALDPSGRPYVAYNDKAYGGVVLAHGPAVPPIRVTYLPVTVR